MATLVRTITGGSKRSNDSPAASRTSLKRTTTTDPLSGSLNHLTPDQVNKLEKFKGELEKDGWWLPEGVNGKPSHDDGTLLRYLRARKFDIAGAIGQFTDTERWLKEQQVDDLYEHFDVDFYEKARTYYPQWTGRRDKRGIPIYVYEIKGLDSKNVSQYQKESQAYKDKLPNHKKLKTPAKMLPLFALYHNLLNMVLPLCSTLERPNPEIPVTNSTNIVDISGVGLTQFWNLKQHMQDASVLATAHYPETLDRIFIIGAPAFFPTVWSWIKRWFDPVTVSKIFILSKSEVKSTLEGFMDSQNIPKKYGGELDWGWGSLPSLGEEERAALESDGNKGWVRGPCLFLDHKRIPVGVENGQLRRSDKEIAEKKPVLYAADYTEEPVHPDRKLSLRQAKKDDKLTNGTSHVPATAETSAPAAAVTVPTVTAATATAATADSPSTTTQPDVAKTPVVDKSIKEPSTPTSSPAQTKTSTKHLNVHNSPSGDSQVHLPAEQPAHPAITAEYISPKLQPQKPTEPVEPPHPEPQVEPQVPAAVAKSSVPEVEQISHASPVVIAPPPGQTQPGPLSQHAIEMSRKIAHNLEGESISVIPETANGPLPHPELMIASDASKGLAIESDKLALSGMSEKQDMPARPTVERFVTAAQF